MTSSPVTTLPPYADVAGAAWRWVLDQVRWDDGPWIPETVPVDEALPGHEPLPDHEPPIPDYRDGMHSGIGGLAHVLAEIRLHRPWTDEERALADGIIQRVRAATTIETSYDYFDGLVSTIGVLSALEAEGVDDAIDRLGALATPSGWPHAGYGPPRLPADTRLSDLTLGTAGVLLAAVWARRRVTPPDASGRATALATTAAEILLAEAEEEPTGLSWLFIPRRFPTASTMEMPNLSHGLAGIAATLAVAGWELQRPDLVTAARRGAEHLVTLADTTGDGFRVPRYLPHEPTNDEDPFAQGWCHGGSGTSTLFIALDRAGVTDVAGLAPLEWHRRALDTIRRSGIPERRHPGFWDNDGRCCGTAGVGEAFLDSWQRGGNPADLDFAVLLANTLVEHAVLTQADTGPADAGHADAGPADAGHADARPADARPADAGPADTGDDRAYWRFTEHRKPKPLQPPGVGWMQGAAGIAAYLLRVDRLLAQGRTAGVTPRLDTWWALPLG
ncbi:MAG: lanthionine synthetase LanC family protein [Lapillicoccus sp.]